MVETLVKTKAVLIIALSPIRIVFVAMKPACKRKAVAISVRIDAITGAV
jgi:hypothetical protein